MIARDRLSLYIKSTGVFPHLVEQRLDDHRTEVLHEGGDRLAARRRDLEGAYADSGLTGDGPAAVLEAWRNAEDELRRMAGESHDGSVPLIESALQKFRRANADGRLHRITEGGEIVGELFAGELEGLRSLRALLKTAALHGTLDDVRQHLAAHEAEEQTGLALQQKRDGCTGKPGCECPWCGGENPCAHVWRTALDGENRPALDDDGCTWEHCGICGVPKDVADAPGELTRTPAAAETETDVEPPFGWVPTCDTGRRTGRLCDAHDGDLIRANRGERP